MSLFSLGLQKSQVKKGSLSDLISTFYSTLCFTISETIGMIKTDMFWKKATDCQGLFSIGCKEKLIQFTRKKQLFSNKDFLKEIRERSDSFI